jgi:SOS-response transcriptional repressor LexA
LKDFDFKRIVEVAEGLIEDKGFDKSNLAKKLGLPSRYIADIKAGKSKQPSPAFVLALINKLNFSPLWLETGEGTIFRTEGQQSVQAGREVTKAGEGGYKVPLLRQKVSCGPGVDWQDEANIVDYIDVFSQIPRLTIKRLFALCVEGSSMLGAGIQNGDYVLFDSAEDHRLRDGIYVFALDGEVYCKRLEFDMEKIKIYSVRVVDLEKAELLRTLNIEEDNFSERFRIFGRVLYWVHPNLE